MSRIEISGLSKSYGSRTILSDINFSMEEGEFVSIVGASASGKTTLIKLISGLATQALRIPCAAASSRRSEPGRC